MLQAAAVLVPTPQTQTLPTLTALRSMTAFCYPTVQPPCLPKFPSSTIQPSKAALGSQHQKDMGLSEGKPHGC